MRMKPFIEIADRNREEVLAVKLNQTVYQFGETVQDALPMDLEAMAKSLIDLQTAFERYIGSSFSMYRRLLIHV